ncbi:MAG: histidinol-phosphate transaminase [Candidatus Omnitrophica bacterium]|nr:histidinol-phosphate transaminase [Candidatus Omnitrophota bacterium]
MLARKNLLDIKNYEPGKPIEEVERELGIKEVIKLASNENPLGPSPKAVAAIRAALKNLNRYPDANSFYLKKRLAAERFELEPSNFVMGNGSDELITIALKAFLNEGEEVIIADTTFLIYNIASQIANARITVVPMRDFKYDLKAMASRISDKTKLIFIANPDNPTGTYCGEEEVAAFMKQVPQSAIVFFDEAYYEFGRQKSDFPETLKYLKGGNVIISRTFSKAYGLSGIRVGYAMASSTLASFMEKVREPFNVNLLAQAAALAALDDEGFLKKTLSNTQRGKDFLYREFGKLGLDYVPSATNFILVNIKKPSKEIFNRMLSEGVIVRGMEAWGLNTFIRVTIGTEKENKKFINILKKIIGSK